MAHMSGNASCQCLGLLRSSDALDLSMSMTLFHLGVLNCGMVSDAIRRRRSRSTWQYAYLIVWPWALANNFANENINSHVRSHRSTGVVFTRRYRIPRTRSAPLASTSLLD